MHLSLGAVWVIQYQMEVIQIRGWHEFFINCIFYLMAAQMFNSATDRLFTLPWWLTVPLAQPVFGYLSSNGVWQCKNWLPNLTLAGNQDTILFVALSCDVVVAYVVDVVLVLILVHVVAVDPKNLQLKFCQNWISNSSDIEDVEFPVVVVVGECGGVKSFLCQIELLLC